MEAARRDLDDDDMPATVEIEAFRAALIAYDPRFVATFDRDLEYFEELAKGDSWSAHALGALLGCVLAYRGEDMAHIRALLDRVVEAGVLLAGRGGGAWAAPQLLTGYWAIDDMQRVLELSAEVGSAGRRSGSLVAVLGEELYPGIVDVRRGALTGAEAHMRAVASIVEQTGMAMWMLSTVHVFVDVLLERPGNEDLIQLMETVQLEDAFLDALAGATLLEPRGRVRRARGDREGAVADLRRAVTTYRALSIGPTFSTSRS